MPIFDVRAPDGSIMKISGPEDATDAELIHIAEQNYKPKQETTLGGNLKEFAKGVIPGGIGLLETAGAGASALLPEEYENPTRKFIQEAAATGRKPFEAAPGYEESVGRKLGEGVGSSIPFFALGPLGMAGRAAAGALGVSAGAGEARMAAEQKGATPEERRTATQLGAPVGLLDILAPEIGPLKHMLTTALARGGVEGATEAAQKIAQNLIAKGVYDPTQDVLVGSGEEGVYGAGIGALTSLIVDLTLGRKSHGVASHVAPPSAAPAPLETSLEAPPEQPILAPTAPEEQKLLPAPPEVPLIGMNPRQIELDKDSLARQKLEGMEPAGATDVTQMPGMTGAPNANVSMMEQARATREAQAKEVEKQRKIEIKKIQSGTFHADPIQNQKIKDKLLADYGVTPTQAKDVFDETVQSNEPPVFNEATPAKLSKKQQEPIYSPEEIADKKDARDALKDVNAQINKAKTEGTDLFNRLKGVLPADEVHNILPEKKKGRIGTLASQSAGTPLSTLVADGSLNEFLPPHLRITEPGQDEMPGVEYITQAIQNGDTKSFDSKLALTQLEKSKEELKGRIEQPEAEREANLNLGAAAEGMADVEGLSFDDLVTHAKNIGVNTDAVVEDVASRSGDLTQEQYKGELHKALISAVNSKSGIEKLASSEKGGEGSSSTKEELQMQKDLEGKTLIQAAQYAVDKAPDAFKKFVAKKVLGVLKAMEATGVNFNFEVQGGNSRSTDLYDARGLATFIWGKEGNATTIVVLLNGTPVLKNQLGYPSGMNYTTLLHELLHVATKAKIRFLPKTSQEVKELDALYNIVVREFNKQARAGTLPPVMEKWHKRVNNVLENSDELLTWGMTDHDVQKWLSDIKVGEKTLMNKLVDLIRNVLGISKPFETALDRLVKTSDNILDIDIKTLDNGMTSYKYSLGPAKSKGKTSPQQQSLFSKRAQELFGQKAGAETTKLGFGKKEQQPTPTTKGQDTLDMLAAMGRFTKEADPTYREKVRASWNNAKDNPKATAEAARATFTSFADKVETWAFSSDAALNNRIRKEIMESSIGQQEKIGLLLNASLSQTVHSDAVASLFLQKGMIQYDKDLHKWVGKDADANFVVLSKQLDEIAKKNGFTKEQVELVAHMAFEAKRTKSLVQFNNELTDKIADIKAEAAAKRSSSPVAANALSKEAARLQEEFKYIHLDQDEINQGMELFKIHPELNDVVGTWNNIRSNASKVLVESGLWSESDADFLLSNADYVPFYREDQLENNQGPKEFIRGLKVQAKERKLKGSDKPVNDIFDNQVRWIQYSVNRAVRNRSALALADTAVEFGAAKQVEGMKDGANVVRIWRDGKEQFYSMDDPMFMDAFNGLEAIVIPSWKWAADVANVLRQSVVMYPLFSVAQVPQDSFAAMFSSGLKPQHALRIPALAVKEFIQTLRGKSKTHEILKNVGAVGVRDFTSAMVRMDAEIYAGLKAPPGVMGKIKYSLNHIAMAADNAVRQAVYEASMDQGLSQAEAMEKSFEVFNVRRKGSSRSLALAGQLIPFFNAYLAAQNVAYKTITGRGISPTARQDAFKTLAATTASTMVLSLLYAMMNGDDEDYLKKPATQRDRLLMIPGTGGMSIPLRADLFTMPKIITEHMYLMMTDKGYEDGRKFRDSMKAALGTALLGPTAVPQAIKPLVEVGINYDFFQGRPMIGVYQQKLDTERQFVDSTSELAKILGKTGMVSPIAADHLIRGMFGSVGGLLLYATNPILHSDPNSPRPSLSDRDALATLPGAAGFMSKSSESALKKDFYTLKEEVDRVANTMNDLKTRSPHEIESFLANDENMARLGLVKSVNAISGNLSKIRKAVAQTTNSNMPSDQKQEQLKSLRETEEAVLKGVNVKALREFGKI